MSTAPSPTVQMFAPDGTLGEIPYERMNEAISAGGKIARHMRAPDGTEGYIPADQADKAIKAGATPIALNVAGPTQPQEGFLGTVANKLSSAAKSIYQDPTGGRSLLDPRAWYDPSQARFDPASSTILKQATRPIPQDLPTDVLAGQGTPGARQVGRAIYRGATMLSPFVPFLDPEASEQAANRGDTGAVAAEAIVPTAAALAPPVVQKGFREAARVTAPMRSALAEKLVSPLVYENVGETGADVRTGINPEKGITQEGLVGTREGLLEQSKARVAELKNSADNILQNHPNSNRIIDAEPIIDGAIDDAIAKTKKVAGSTERLEALRDALKTQYGKLQGTPYEINNLKTDIQKAGNQLGAYRNTQPIEGTLADAMKDTATRIRSAVNDLVPEAADLNNRMANSIDAQSGLQKGINAEKGKSVFGGFHEGTLSKVLNRTAGSAPARSGIARLLNAGNTLDVPGPMAISPFVPRGLFDNPTSAVPAGWEAPDTSGPIRGGRWTTPAALLPDQTPIDAEFIPRRVPTETPFRAPISRMLPSGELPETNIPPALNPQYSVEDLRTPDSTRLGPPGSEATRTEAGDLQSQQRPKRPTRGLLPWNSIRGAAYREGP